MDDIISLALAAEQTAIARQALDAARYGAWANAAVVVASLGIALTTGIAAFRLRKRQEKDANLTAYVMWTSVLGNVVQLRNEFRNLPPDERVDYLFLTGILKQLYATYGMARPTPISDLGLRVATGRVMKIVELMRLELERYDAIQAQTNASLADRLDEYVQHAEVASQRLEATRTRLKIAVPDHVEDFALEH